MLGRHVIAVLRQASAAILEVPTPRFNSLSDLRRALKAHPSTTVINCIGYTGQDAGQHLMVNAGFPRVIAEHCVREGTLAVQISTNGVFGADEWRTWLPADPTDPRTPYELSKALGEDPRLMVIRASFVGKSPKKAGLYEKLKAGDSYSERRWNGVTALALAQHVASTISQWDGVMRSGIEHVYSASVASYGELADCLQSKSLPNGEKGFSKLLGGGTSFPDIRKQLEEYHVWLSKGGDSLLGLSLS